VDAEPQIFVSDRRDDAPAHPGMLVGALGKSRVFFDIGSIHGGAKFAEVIHEALGRAEVVIAVIGPRGWSRPTRTVAAASTTRKTSSAKS
jgi:hypothetical protein